MSHEHSPRDVVSVPLGIERGYVTLDVSVGAVSARFCLDTGADVTVLTPALAERLELETLGWHDGGVAGGRRLKVRLVELDRVVAGGRSVSLSPVAVVDLGQATQDLGEVGGVLGSDFLCQGPFTLDYAEAVLVFENEASLAERARNGVTVPLRVENGRTPYLRVRIDDRLDVDYKLDTGAGRTQVRTQDLAALGVDVSVLEPTEKHGLGGAYSVYPLTLASLSAGPSLSVEGLAADAQDVALGFVGANYLSHFVVTLDYGGGRAIFGRAR